MLSLDDTLIRNQQSLYKQVFKDGSSAPFLQADFFKKALPKLHSEYAVTYPYTVKLPKSLRELAEGDYTPAREILIEKPIEVEGTPIWFGDATDIVTLRLGYQNGDSRYICSQELGDNGVHMMLGGSTGQGKSVALNSLIYGLCYEYPPWGLRLVMSDAKIVEFKFFAENRLPHITTIAATNDADYVIAVLEDLCNEMKFLNSAVFAGKIKNIREFRKETGLTLPRTIIVMDEVQAMLANAGKKQTKIVKLIDDFARLGRNTGFHLIMASQEPNIDKNILTNVKVRAAVGCTSDISTKLIGNTGASDIFGEPGKLIFNINSDAGKMEDNVLMRVPYMGTKMQKQLGEDLLRIGEYYNVIPQLEFYDADKTVPEKEYLDYIKSFPSFNPRTIYLGEPSRRIDDEEKVVKLEYSGDERDTLCLLSNDIHNQIRFFKMVKMNLDAHPSRMHLGVVADMKYVKSCGIDDFIRQDFIDLSGVYEDNRVLDIAYKTICRRKLMLMVDDVIFGQGKDYDGSQDHLFYRAIEKGSRYDTKLSRLRYYVADNLLQKDKVIIKLMGLSDVSKDVLGEKIIKEKKIILELYHTYGSSDTRLTEGKLPEIFVWVFGLSRLYGIGVDGKNKYKEELKKFLAEGYKHNVHFIFMTNTMTDMTELVPEIRWFISSNIPTQELSKIKATEDYPEFVAPSLAVKFDVLASGERCIKFKKMRLEGEIFA